MRKSGRMCKASEFVRSFLAFLYSLPALTSFADCASRSCASARKISIELGRILLMLPGRLWTELVARQIRLWISHAVHVEKA